MILEIPAAELRYLLDSMPLDALSPDGAPVYWRWRAMADAALAGQADDEEDDPCLMP